MLKDSILSKSIRFALVAGATSTAFMYQTVKAADEPSAEKVERIEVTGSRIKRADMEGANPVTVFDKETIAASGVVTIGEFLATAPQADLSGLTQMTNNTNANDGSQTISLRNMGDERTLVLVDGRRFLALGGGQVDISQIPVAIVERIDILADGASAVYGTDAIAGVVNIITKKGYEGVSAEIGGGANFEGDGESLNYGLSVGTIKDNTSLFFNINKTEQDPIYAGDRELSKYPTAYVPQRAGSSFGLYGIFGTSDGLKALNPDKEGAGMRTEADFEAFGTKHRYNFAPTNYLFMPSDRLNIFSKVEHEFNDNIRGFVNFTYNQRQSITQIAPVPLTAGFSGPQWEITYSKDNHYNPFGEDLSQWGFRTLPVGPRTSNQDYDTYFSVAGFEGDFELADRTFSWDVAWTRGDSSRTETGENYINLGRLANAVGPSFVDAAGVAKCGTADNVIRGCVPLNLFNGVTGFTTEMQDYIGYDFVQTVSTGVTGYSGNISTELFELPAGGLGLAAGFEKRTNDYADTPDALITSGLSSTNYREPTNGEQEAQEIYFELAVPILADLPGAKALDISIAGRNSEFTNSGFIGKDYVESDFDNTSFKYGITWRIYDDLMLRGNYSDTFRAPSVDNLFSGGAEGFPQVQDPCNTARYPSLSAEAKARCKADGVPEGGATQLTGQLRSLGGGNPFLSPEEGVTKTVGLVFNPSWLEGFDITVDYWDIYLEQALSSLGAGTMLNRCYVEGLSDFCSFVERGGDGSVSTVRTAQFNLNELQTSGYDLDVNYRFDTDSMGAFAFRLSGSYTEDYRFAGEGESLSDADNQVGRVDSEILKLRGTFYTTWTYDDLSVTWAMRYIDDITESCAVNPSWVSGGLTEKDPCNMRDQVSEDYDWGLNHIGSITYHDISANYALPWNANVRAGMRNVFRTEPPAATQVFANGFYGMHDIPGGTWFVQYKQDF